MYICIRTPAYMYTCPYTYIDTYQYIAIDIPIYICKCICVYIAIYVRISL